MNEMIPQEAARTAFAWVEAIQESPPEISWAMRDDNLRLCETQLFLWANRGESVLSNVNLDDLAIHLAQAWSSHALWPDLIQARQNVNVDALPQEFDDNWGPLSARRVVGADLEVAMLADPDSIPGGVAEESDVISGLAILLRGSPEVGYRVAAMQDYHAPIPGWPPQPGGPTDVVDK